MLSNNGSLSRFEKKTKGFVDVERQWLEMSLCESQDKLRNQRIKDVLRQFTFHVNIPKTSLLRN